MLRRPDLTSFNCLVRYFSPCPANFGKEATALLPSEPWQPEHMAVFGLPKSASPAAKLKEQAIMQPKTTEKFKIIFFIS
jgi:hypothetical protein